MLANTLTRHLLTLQKKTNVYFQVAENLQLSATNVPSCPLTRGSLLSTENIKPLKHRLNNANAIR